MAEGWLRQLGGYGYEVFSAGTNPQPMNPDAVRVMAEVGVNIGDQRSKHVARYLDSHFDTVVTVCGEADETCPAFMGEVGKRVHWSIDDPAAARGSKEEILATFRRVRDEIKKKVEELIGGK
jgi:arsenate reductase